MLSRHTLLFQVCVIQLVMTCSYRKHPYGYPAHHLMKVSKAILMEIPSFLHPQSTLSFITPLHMGYAERVSTDLERATLMFTRLNL